MTQITLFGHEKSATQPIKLKQVATATRWIKIFESHVKCWEYVFTKRLSIARKFWVDSQIYTTYAAIQVIRKVNCFSGNNTYNLSGLLAKFAMEKAIEVI